MEVDPRDLCAQVRSLWLASANFHVITRILDDHSHVGYIGYEAGAAAELLTVPCTTELSDAIGALERLLRVKGASLFYDDIDLLRLYPIRNQDDFVRCITMYEKSFPR